MPSFKIEFGEVKMYENGALVGSLGTMLPNDEQIARILARAFEAGRKDKAREIRGVLGL